MLNLLALPFLGLIAGALGTLIGAGGGFLLVPVLLAAMPGEPPGIITGISQTVVALNALSGSIAYARQGRIEYRWAALLSLTGLIGMAIGAFVTEHLSRGRFQVVFGLAVLVLAAYLLARPVQRGAARTLEEAWERRIALTGRHIPLGAAMGLAVGYLGGLLGIGGGIALVPLLVQLLAFPAHIATATSQLVIVLTSPAAIAVHAASAPLLEKAVPILLLGAGAMAGAQGGAWLSRRFSAIWLVRILAVALATIGLRLVLAAGS